MMDRLELSVSRQPARPLYARPAALGNLAAVSV